MHILELCLSPDLGGLELYAYRCADALKSSDRVSAVLNENGKLREYFAPLKLDEYFFAPRVKKLPLLSAHRLAAIIDREEVDVIHVHWGKDLPLAAFAKAISKRKPRLVYTRQMQITRSKRDPYHNFLYGQMDRMLTITEQLAASARDKLRAGDANKVATLYYGVAKAEPLSSDARAEIRSEWGVPEEAILTGLFGRMEPYKGQHLFIDALAQAKRDGLNAWGLLVGHEMEPGYADELRALAKEKDVLERLVFRPFTKDPKPWMQSCDALLLATVEETFGLVLAEAMRAGVAVIGSNRGGVLEIIDHEINGLLFESENSDDLYAQLRRYIEDDEFRKTMAAAGEHDADERFNEEGHFTRLRELLS